MKKRRPAELIGFFTLNDKPCFKIACFRVNHNEGHNLGDYSADLAFVCPFCGNVHFHGVATPLFGGEDGHRIAHCHSKSLLNSAGYYLVEQERYYDAGDLPKKLLQAAEKHRLKQLWESYGPPPFPEQGKAKKGDSRKPSGGE